VPTFNLNPKTDDGAENLLTAVTVGVPLLNLFVAGYLFVSALVTANSGGELTVSTGWAVAASGSSGIVLATVLFWLGARGRRVEAADSTRRSAAAKRALTLPTPQFQPTPSITMVVRRPRSPRDSRFAP
jgi:hypothetical protein